MKNKKKTIEKKKHYGDDSGIFVPAGLFIGLGFGFLTGQLVAGLFLGLGFGFLIMGLIKRKNKTK